MARNRDGDYASAAGRTLIVRLLRRPRWMLFIDGQPIARTRTVTDARHQAWVALHGREVADRTRSAAARHR